MAQVLCEHPGSAPSKALGAFAAVCLLLLVASLYNVQIVNDSRTYMRSINLIRGAAAGGKKAGRVVGRTYVEDLARLQERSLFGRIVLHRPDGWQRCKSWYQLAEHISKCMSESIVLTTSSADGGMRLWNGTEELATKCGVDLLRRMLHTKVLVNRDDIKVVVLPRLDSAGGQECTSVTIGIGNDIAAEVQLNNLLPHCRFYGVDPILESGRVFKDIGTYFNFGVASRGGSMNASVLSGGKYTWKRIAVKSLGQFIADDLNATHIDYLFMDIEGAEFSLLPQLGINGSVGGDVTVCQINVEVHGPLESYNVTPAAFAAAMRSLVVTGQYVPLWWPPPLHHHRMAFINWWAPACVTKFYSDWCG